MGDRCFMAEKKDNNAISNITRKIVSGGGKAITKAKGFFQTMPKPTRIFVFVLMVAVVAEIPIFIAIGMGARGQAPYMHNFSPSSPNISISEGQVATFNVNIIDPDGSALLYAWTIDGRPIAAAGSSYSFFTDTRSGGKQYYVEVTASDGTHQVKQAWTLTVINVLTNLGPIVFDNDECVVNDGVIYFSGDYSTLSTPFGYELWRSDGTASGTYMIDDLRPGSNGSDPDYLVLLNDEIFFVGRNDTGEHLYKTNGTAECISLVKVINPSDYADIEQMTAGIHWLFFMADNGVNGSEIWRSNGTAAGTSMVADLNPGAGDTNATSFVAIGDLLFFKQFGEPWISNGTAAGTHMLKDINAGGISDPSSMGFIGNTLFFAANDTTHGIELWKTDGTEAGTVLVKDINQGATTAGMSEDGGEAAVIDNVMYFTANDTTHGYELWKTDGTEAGTVLVKDINTAGSSEPRCLTVVGNNLFFAADDNTHGFELWKTDGTEAGTVLVKDINTIGDSRISGGSKFRRMGSTEQLLVFSASDGIHDREPWVSDGTETGTFMIKDIDPNGESRPSNFHSIGNAVLFVTSEPSIEMMWVY